MNIMLIMFMIPIIILGTAVFSINKSIVIENPVQIEHETAISSDMAISTFNARFEVYEGSGLSPSMVRSIFAIVQSNNAENEEHIVEIDNSTDSISTANELNVSKNYNVELQYDNEGYVCKITITEQ